MLHPFLHNITLLTGVCFLQWLLVRHVSGSTRRPLLEGMVFGAATMAGMTLPVWQSDGIFFDGRSVMLSLAAFICGPVAGIVAGLMAAAYRLWLGGSGAPVGVAVIASSVALGWSFTRLVPPNAGHRLLFMALLSMGFAVHAVAIAWFALLPIPFVDVVLAHVALPYVGVFTLATAIIGLVLLEFEKVGQVNRIIGESEDRYRRLFDGAAISLWDEDVSGVLKAFEELRGKGVTSLRDHLRENPGAALDLAGRIRISRVNAASLAMFKAGSEEELKAALPRTFGPEAEAVFREELCALWEGRSRFQATTSFRSLDGERVDAVVSVALPKSATAARSMPVSILDVTDIRAAEASLQRSLRRLEDILWSTRAGTWEWMVQDGQTVFNERWAEIVGYTLDELSPISIQTWIDLTHPDDLARSDALLKRIFARELEDYECEARMRHKDGHWVWIADRGKVVEWLPDGRPQRMTGTHIDITASKAAESDLERLSAVRAMLLEGHGVIVRAANEQELMQNLCEVLVRHRGHALAWIGIPQDDAVHRVMPVASAGPRTDYLEGLELHGAEDDLGRGPTGRAIRSRTPQTMHASDPQQGEMPWVGRLKRFGLASSVAVPVCRGTKVLAVLNVYSTSDTAFDPGEVALLSEFAENLALALQGLRTTGELREVSRALEESSLSVIAAMSATLEQRDPYTAGHQLRVAHLSTEIAGRLGWNHKRIEGLRLGALIHDIGKISVPAEILNRPGRLSDAEMAIIRTHPTVGGEILEGITFPWPIREMVLQHHERIDGSGYPEGLKGDAIVEEAKILAAADVMEAITSHRPYRPSLGVEKGIEELRRGRGTLYDPAVVDACLAVVEDPAFAWPKAG